MKRHYVKGLRFRLTIVYSSLFGFFICIFAYILSAQYLDLLRQDFDAALLNFGVDITRSEEITPGYTSRFRVRKLEERKQLPFAIGSTVYFIRSIDGMMIEGSPDRPEGLNIPYRSDLPRSPDYTHRFLSHRFGGINYRAVNIKMTNPQGKVLILQIATPSTILTEQQNRLLYMNLFTIPLLILISSIASYLIAGNALNPVKVLTNTARSIAAENLSQRVPEVNTQDEVAELSRTFNNLLERLEKSFRAQENFVANASHQLNTPLSIIKGELDLLESKSRTPEEEKKFRTSLREELERLINLVKKLLLVSRVEAGHGNFIMTPLRLDEILLSTTSRLNGIARLKKINIRFNIGESLEEDTLIIKGDRQLLDAMFENILENAVKYSPPETTVTISVEKIATQIEVSVSDDGPGMTLKSWENIIQGRFKRGEGITMPGTGIGLSIVQSIAELHGAVVQYRPRSPRGCTIVVSFSSKSIS
jgi:signal transduction histidine kinase